VVLNFLFLQLLAHVTEVRKYFDSRAFNVPSNAEVFVSILPFLSSPHTHICGIVFRTMCFGEQPTTTEETRSQV